MRSAHHTEKCPYCNGQGYFQLVLGGTENCPSCNGAGINDPKGDPVAVVSNSSR